MVVGTIQEIKYNIIQANKLDKILYEDVLSNSIVLQDTIKKGKTIFHSFESLVEEIFYLLYKIIINIHPSLLTEDAIKNKEIIEYLKSSYSIKKIRQRTAGSFPNTALSLKTVLDEIIQSLRGSQLSKDIKRLQAEVFELTIRKQELENKLSDFNYTIEALANNLPFEKKIKDLLEDINNLLHRKNNSRDTLEILQEIINTTKEILKNPNNNASYLLDSIVEDSIRSLERQGSPIKNTAQETLQELLEEIKENIESYDTKTNSGSKSSLEKKDYGDNNSSYRDSLGMAIDEIQKEVDNFLSSSIKASNRTPNKGDILNNLEVNNGIDKGIIIDGKKEEDSPIFEYNEGHKNIIHQNKELNKELNVINYSYLLRDLLLSTQRELQNKKQSLKTQLNKLNLDSAIDKAIDTINEFDTAINTLNINKNSLNTLTFDEIINFSKEYLRPEMKDFINKVGKKKEIAKREQSKKKKSKERLTDKTLLSSDLENLVDDELMNLSMGIEVFENSFIERYLNDNLTTYKKIRYVAKNKGPIILCYDGSGSMEGDKILETKRNIITFIEIARLQRRKILLIQFASQTEPLFIKELNPGRIDIRDINEIISTFLCGGTDFEKPLQTAISYLKTNNYKNADILFITDGVCSISEEFKKDFLQSKKNNRFKLYTIIIYTDTYEDYGDIGEISDEIMELKRINLNNWNEKISKQLFSL